MELKSLIGELCSLTGPSGFENDVARRCAELLREDGWQSNGLSDSMGGGVAGGMGGGVNGGMGGMTRR